jgi:hypothetical protein
LQSISIGGSRKDPSPPAGALLPHKVHLIFPFVINFQLGQGVRGLGNELALTESPRVIEELFLEVFGDILFDDDVVAVALLTVS